MKDCEQIDNNSCSTISGKAKQRIKKGDKMSKQDEFFEKAAERAEKAEAERQREATLRADEDALRKQRKRWGPPRGCWHCGGALVAEKEATSQGSGCALAVLGFLLSWTCIGLLVMIYGLSLMGKRKGIWRCRDCEGEFPRRIRWYEFG